MSTIATQISLVRYSGTIFDQQTQGSCVANAICGAVALQMNEMGVHIADLSRQQLYNDTRSLMNTFDRDSGSTLNAAWAAAQTNGIANESSFTYGLNNLFAHPSAAVEAEAATQKVLSHTTLNMNQNSTAIAKMIGEQLMQGKPVLVASTVHIGFGVDPNSRMNPINGGHEYIIEGINYATQEYDVIQNSWGTGWANGGFGKTKFTDLPGLGSYGQPSYAPDLIQLDVINGMQWHGSTYDWTWTADRIEIAKLYAGLLDRCGENFGVTAWANNLHNGTSITAIADAFVGSTEGQSLYGSMTNSQYAGAMYFNATGRAADQATADFFGNQLSTGTTRGQLAYSLIHWVDIGNDTQAANDRIDNLATVSMNYAITMQIDGSHYAAAVHALQGVTSDANSIQLALIGVQHDLAV